MATGEVLPVSRFSFDAQVRTGNHGNVPGQVRTGNHGDVPGQVRTGNHGDVRTGGDR